MLSLGRGLRPRTPVKKENRGKGARWRTGVHHGVVADHLGSRCRKSPWVLGPGKFLTVYWPGAAPPDLRSQGKSQEGCDVARWGA